MRYRLDLTLRHAEGALARVLGTAERRGFRPVAVEGERPAETLHAQLAKLYDCLHVQVQPCS